MPAANAPNIGTPLLGQKGSRRRIPFIQQLTPTDCGPACLAMVLGYYGRYVPLEEIRELLSAGRDGASAFGILSAARSFGLRGRGVKLSLADLAQLPAASILYWDFTHFVVFERAGASGIVIVDPELGRREIPHEEVSQSFTGVALTLEPASGFTSCKQPRGSWRRYLALVLSVPQHFPRIATVSLVLQFLALALPLLTASVVDKVVPRSDAHLLQVIGCGMVSLVALQFLASMVRAHLLLNLRTILDAEMGIGFIDHLLSLPYHFLQRRSTGDLLLRLSSNATIRELLTSGALSACIDGSLIFFYFGLLLLSSSKFTLLVALMATAEIVAFVVARRRQVPLIPRELSAQAKLQGYQVELLSGIEAIKSMGVEGRAIDGWQNLSIDVLNIALERGRVRATYESIASTLRTCFPLVLLTYGAQLVVDGALTLGTMLALNALAMGVLVPLNSLGLTVVQLQMLTTYIERVDDIMTAKPEEDKSLPRRAMQLAGGVTLDRVTFSYSKEVPPVVDDVSLSIAPGQFVAIVGRTGSGKSSLARLLVGLYTPNRGRVLFDGVDVKDLDLSVLRSQMGIVTQRTHLFASTIRHNIALADPMTPLAEVVAAAEIAEVREEVEAMSLGFSTPIVDGGASLSGGQRQRIALARALLRQPALLLLDEATSALDVLVEQRIQARLAALNCTRVVIAHRLSTIRQADVIYVMDKGKIVESGSHDELLAQPGLYRQLVSAQAAPVPNELGRQAWGRNRPAAARQEHA